MPTCILDFSDAGQPELIPHETVAKVRMIIRRGGYNDPARGWEDDYATRSIDGQSVYLRCEFVVIEGPYARRRFWDNLGLHSEKNNNAFGKNGRMMIRRVLESHFGLDPDDCSPDANRLRCIPGLKALDGLEFFANIGIKSDKDGRPCNGLRIPICPAANSANAESEALRVPDSPHSGPTEGRRPGWTR